MTGKKNTVIPNMIRRKPLEEEDNPDRWLVSYADFITLLFAFFVVMYAISSINQGKYNELTNSMGNAFSGVRGSDQQQINIKKAQGSDGVLEKQKSVIKPLPLTQLYQEKSRRERESMTNMGVALSNKLAPLISQGKLRVMQNNRGIRIDINDSLLFSPGSAQLSPAAAGIMQEIAQLIKTSQRLVQVEGHTDNIAIHNDTFYSNWELSAVRASSVVRQLSAGGIADARLSALGFGSVQPVSENQTANGRAKNRRVSVLILYESQQQADAALEIKPSAEIKPPAEAPPVINSALKP
jgi:chemotaxis protein MotB